jgi:glycosyltransferase involved in cell wall biosynthesis
MKISLIIAYYKNLDALDLILKALQKQTFTDFEVIIAEDDNDVASFKYIQIAQQNMPFRSPRNR